ncbi:MAG: cupin domain-containing protein [Acidimicrobiia bacterium]|nr:cupin domain-containing protein [Acidimicrobiia bacterium]
MRAIFVLSLMVPVATAFAQGKPAERSTLAITVTNPRGLTLPGVRVELTGPVTREGTTDASGMVRFVTLRAGAYRARFSGDDLVTFEKEVALREGQALDVDATLNAAEPVREPPPPPPPPPPPLGPAGEPRTASLVELAERELVDRNQDRRETLVACSGNTRSTLLQINEPQAARLYAGAESLLYVVAGEGTVSLGGVESPLRAGAFVSVPRSVPYGLSRRGNRPLILLSVLAGEPCEQPR